MRVALVIGLQLYGSLTQGGLGNLSGPHTGALLIQQKLVSIAGFDPANTILHRDVFGQPQGTRQDLYEAIQQFRNKLQALPRGNNAKTVAFFYYSGHGAYNGKHHYLLPKDSQAGIDADLQGIDFEDSILHHMVKHASVSIGVLDCCRDGDAHFQGYTPVLRVPAGHQYLVCYACAPFARAPANGIYTKALLQHIFKQDESFMELVGEANTAAVEAGYSEPQMGPTISPLRFVLVEEVGWRFAHRQDTRTGCDIECTAVNSDDGMANIKMLAMAAQGHGMTAMAFNTQGHIKDTAGELDDMPMEHWNPEPAGVFVRDARVPRGWLYFPDMNSPGEKSRPLQGTVLQMAEVAATQGAVAFHSDGWAMDELLPFSDWQQEVKVGLRYVDGLNGIFVRVCRIPEAPTLILHDDDLEDYWR